MKKKKTYLYFIVPLVLTVVFAFFYAGYHEKYEARVAAAEKKMKDERDAKLAKEAKDREKAIAEAVAATEKRKQEKLAKEARDAKEREDREKAVQERNKAREESSKFADRVKELEKEVKEAEETIVAIKKDHQELRDEEGFLREFVKKAEANQQSLTAVLEKIEAAEKARADAAKAAAAAKKS